MFHARTIRQLAVATAAALLVTAISAAPAGAAPPPPAADDHLAVYTGTVDADGLAAIVDLGIDRHDIVAAPVDGDPNELAVEVIISGEQAAALAETGTALEQKTPDAARRSLQVDPTVFRRYAGAGGLQEELQSQAAAHPTIAELEVIGQTVMGQDITAVRVTKNPARTKDGKRPATVFMGAQHAREWITPEMVRRLLDQVLNGYGSDPKITELVNSTEMWFIPVANPDGYDFTFEEDQRLWRKNLRDNNGDGITTVGDGVDLNRNYPTRWGYDNEGSSPNPASDTYRGPAPASEPETQALDSLFDRITPEFLINYHSAAELLLHGIGWQVATPSPDDVIYEAMVGDDANPAVPGYDPDISAELYVTNGDTDSHMQEAHGTLGFTPEMATCESASDSVPDDEWEAADCESGFNFPDDEELIQTEFEKNVPFALSVAESALDPNDPVSVVDREAADFTVDTFDVSYGDSQPVAVVAKRDLLAKFMSYRINGGRTQVALVKEWQGGERYGDENDDYFAEYRGTVRGASPGDTVEVWFSAFPSIRDLLKGEKVRKIESEHFTYTLAQDTGTEALVIANEDYTGVNPTYPAGTNAPKYLDEHVAALEANGVTPDVWDVDAQGVPHDLAVLGHYDTVLWYLGDNRLTQDPEDELTEVGSGALPDLSVAERTQYLTIAVRDFMNEGGKLAYAGETTGYYGVLAGTLGGLYYGLNGAPEAPCAVTEDLFSDCLLYADDFTQYWLGANNRTPLAAGGVLGTADPFGGFESLFGGPATSDNPVNEAGALIPTSEVLPADEFPQFESSAIADYLDPQGPFIAVEGEWAMAATHIDDGYQRLARTYDLSTVTAADAPAFEAQFSFSTEEAYDHVIVEARQVGTDAWTTLADANGGTTSDVPAECEAGFFVDEHPQLEHYLTVGDPCTPTGSSGQWNSFTASSNGWVPVSFDLSAFAGQQVEIVVSYVTDPFTGETGLIVDDTSLEVAGVPTEAEGFESGLGAWTVPGAPETSPGNASDFERTRGLGGVVSAVRAADSIMLGFGLEQLESDAARADAVGRILAYLQD
ncbi:M14 family metallopeptidase [Agromyces subbeticus]|uniref:M14 family metallopeptidase n=1 Tax=Agromyces subbeticus TaxID=293890 RepID=UPI0003B5A3AC|nr:M14 family metallopeptidase [Agromyces subbeticus]